MADKTKVEWAHATVNWWAGCNEVSPACANCYAKRMAGRLWGVPWGAGQPRLKFAGAAETLRALNRKAKRLGQPLRVFHDSLSDIFDNEVPPEWRAEAFELMAETKHLIHLLLTKRIGNVKKLGLPLTRTGDVFPNVWIGATIANREEMLRDGPKLMRVPARIRFWSAEPLLGDLGNIPAELMPDWGIVGFESGPHARPGHPVWARNARDQFVAARKPFFFKQWGGWAPYDRSGTDGAVLATPNSLDEPLQKFGKKLAGRLLDGRTWDEVPA